jgi:hypothetical protein
MRQAIAAGGGEARPAPGAVISTFVDVLGRLAAASPVAAPAPAPPRGRRVLRKG